jgi:DivIVA domain-containing protein
MKLTYKKIVNKKFETVINGYSPTQVDIYLDLVCSDYIEHGEIITTLNSEIDAFKKEISNLKKELKSKNKELKSKNKDDNL